MSYLELLKDEPSNAAATKHVEPQIYVFFLGRTTFSLDCFHIGINLTFPIKFSDIASTKSNSTFSAKINVQIRL